MLKNELSILTTAFTAKNRVSAGVNERKQPDFSKVVLEGCDRAMQAWAISAFSDHPNESLERYFDYHFNFLNGLIAEHAEDTLQDPLKELFKLMDHLLLFYGNFINCQQSANTKYLAYRSQLSLLKYKKFVDQVSMKSGDKDLENCFAESLSPLYCGPPAEPQKLSALFYREALLNELAGRRHNSELVTADSLISVLFSFNFNHTRFLAYLRKRTIKGFSVLTNSSYSEYFLQISSEIPTVEISDQRRYDPNWPHIAIMYKDWLNDYAALLTIALGTDNKVGFNKVPLAISVKQLACLIRAFYESGFYGNIKLTAIFDHAATVFTTKRQEHISAESISNAYYALPQSSVLKISRMLSKATDFLKPYCYHVEAVKDVTSLSPSKNQSARQTTRS